MKYVAIAAIFLSILLTYSDSASAENARLFRMIETPHARSVESRSSVASVRESEVVFNSNILNNSQKLDISLFDGKTHEAKRLTNEGLETRAFDDLTWRGKIAQGEFAGDVVITQKGGYFAGIIYSADAVYEIVPKGDKHFLVELDQTLFPPCAGGVKGDEVPNIVSVGAGSDSGDRIDVLVLYTAAVRTAAGGDAQIQTVAQQAIDSTNTSYINSRIRQRVRLVGAELTALVETGNFSTELSNLRNDTATNSRRDALKADLVDMFTTSTAACGIGYLMGPVGGNANNGYTVTARTCAVGNLSFAHELGHNMGSHHNPENGGTPTFPFAFGHYVNGSYRTVMSYVDPCTSGCTRVPYFSNPNVIFNGQPTGVNNARDNARSIELTADWIANYRYSGSSITLGNYNGGIAYPRNIRQSLIWTSDNAVGDVKIEISRDGGASWATLFNPTPNDNQEYFALGTRATKQGRIRITSLSNPAISDTSVANFGIR